MSNCLSESNVTIPGGFVRTSEYVGFMPDSRLLVNEPWILTTIPNSIKAMTLTSRGYNTTGGSTYILESYTYHLLDGASETKATLDPSTVGNQNECYRNVPIPLSYPMMTHTHELMVNMSDISHWKSYYVEIPRGEYVENVPVGWIFYYKPQNPKPQNYTIYLLIILIIIIICIYLYKYKQSSGNEYGKT